MGVSIANLREKEPDVISEKRNLASLLFHFAFSLETRISEERPYRPESYTNDIKVNPTQKDNELFVMLIRTLRDYFKLL